MRKRFVSMLLVLAMVLSFVPAFQLGASAAETPTEVSTETGLAAGGYLKLTQDITLTNNCPLPDNTTIALNGNTIYQGTGMLLSGTGLVFEISSADDIEKAKTIFNWIAAGTYTWKLKNDITITKQYDHENSNENDVNIIFDGNDNKITAVVAEPNQTKSEQYAIYIQSTNKAGKEPAKTVEFRNLTLEVNDGFRSAFNIENVDVHTGKVSVTFDNVNIIMNHSQAPKKDGMDKTCVPIQNNRSEITVKNSLGITMDIFCVAAINVDGKTTGASVTFASGASATFTDNRTDAEKVKEPLVGIEGTNATVVNYASVGLGKTTKAAMNPKGTEGLRCKDGYDLAVAKIDDTVYGSLVDAVASVKASTATTIKLLGNVTENVTIPAGRFITLDLNGKVLKAKNAGSVITNNGTLTVNDTATENNTHYFKVNADGMWVLDDTLDSATYTFDAVNGLKKDGETTTDIPAENAVIKVTGGVITGGTGNYGGAIRNKSDLKLIGGNLVGNAVNSEGGAVRNSLSFQMSGGAIAGCTAENGGAILNDSSATNFTLNGGVIAYCSATAQGGAVYNIGAFDMTDGKIIGCSAKNGGGVFVTKTATKFGKFTMSGGSIEKCVAENNGGGVVNFSGNTTDFGFIMTAGTISDCKAKYGGGVFANGENDFSPYTKLGSGIIKDNECTSRGGGVYFGPLTESTLTGNIKIKNNKGNPEKYGAVSNLMTLKAVKIDNLGSGADVGVALFDGTDVKLCAGAFTTNGTSADKQYFSSDSKAYGVIYNAGTGSGGYLELVESPCTYPSTLTAGKGETLVLGGKTVGEFTIEGDTTKGFTVVDKDGNYIACINGSIERRNDPFTWKYDGGLYTEISTTVKTRFLFWTRITTKLTKRYLGYANEQFAPSEKFVIAQTMFTDPTGHSYTYENDGDGCHVAVCTKCGKREEAEEHDFTFDTTNHKCICGAIDPQYCYVSGVTVNERRVNTTVRFLFWKKTMSYYEYTIGCKAQNTCVFKVEYSGNGEDYSAGNTFKSDVKLYEFYIRITDMNGKVTNWKYENGKVK